MNASQEKGRRISLVINCGQSRVEARKGVGGAGYASPKVARGGKEGPSPGHHLEHQGKGVPKWGSPSFERGFLGQK